MTRKQRVLRELIDAYNGKKYEYNFSNWISGGWTPIGAIVNPSVGGSEGTRRVRELKARGIKINCRYYFIKDDEGKWGKIFHNAYVPISELGNYKDQRYRKTSTTIYKLLTDPELIDTDKCELKPVEPEPELNFMSTYKL